jgi:uncharacterized ParB-like nuclease family protein
LQNPSVDVFNFLSASFAFSYALSSCNKYESYKEKKEEGIRERKTEGSKEKRIKKQNIVNLYQSVTGCAVYIFSMNF